MAVTALTCDRVREVAPGFVLGALDADEMIAVGNHLDTCSQPHPEVDDFGGVLPYIAESLEPVEPPAWLRESVISAARADLVARRRAGKSAEHRVVEPVAIPVVSDAQGSRPAPVGRIVSLAAARISRHRRVLTWTMRAAAAVVILALSVNTVILQGELARAQKIQSQDANITYALGQPGTRSASLQAIDGSSANGLAVLRSSGNIQVKLHSLAATHGDQVYMVWLSTDSGTPAKVGWLTADDSGEGYITVDHVPTSASLWIFVCKEPNSNVTKPTGLIVLSGTFAL
jgi:hypothetical protein